MDRYYIDEQLSSCSAFTSVSASMHSTWQGLVKVATPSHQSQNNTIRSCSSRERCTTKLSHREALLPSYGVDPCLHVLGRELTHSSAPESTCRYGSEAEWLTWASWSALRESVESGHRRLEVAKEQEWKFNATKEVRVSDFLAKVVLSQAVADAVTRVFGDCDLADSFNLPSALATEVLKCATLGGMGQARALTLLSS